MSIDFRAEACTVGRNPPQSSFPLDALFVTASKAGNNPSFVLKEQNSTTLCAAAPHT